MPETDLKTVVRRPLGTFASMKWLYAGDSSSRATSVIGGHHCIVGTWEYDHRRAGLRVTVYSGCQGGFRQFFA